MQLARDAKGRVLPGQSLNLAGKPKGTRDKYHELVAELEKAGHNPIRAAIQIYQNEEIEWTVRERANKSLLDRYMPTLKAVEHSISKDTFDAALELKKQMLQLQLDYEQNY